MVLQRWKRRLLSWINQGSWGLPIFKDLQGFVCSRNDWQPHRLRLAASIVMEEVKDGLDRSRAAVNGFNGWVFNKSIESLGSHQFKVCLKRMLWAFYKKCLAEVEWIAD